MEQLPILPIIILLAAAFLMPLIGAVADGLRISRVRDFFTVICVAAAGIVCFELARLVWSGEDIIYRLGGWDVPLGITLNIDGFNSLIALLVIGVSFLVLLFVTKDHISESGGTQFYALYLLYIVGALGVILTGDIFNLFVFLEIMSVATYGLVAFEVHRKRAISGTFKYLILGAVSTGLVLIGVIMLYGMVGTLNMQDIVLKVQSLGMQSLPLALPLALALLMVGVGLKAAMVPIHAWKPEAYAGASMPVGALLATVTSSVGLYALVRLLTLVFAPWLEVTRTLFLVFVVITLIVGAFLMLRQDDLRRLLAYSSITQVGYLLLGLGLATPLALSGTLFHLVNFIVMEALLFLSAGVIIRQAGSSDLRNLGGWGRKLPTMTALFGIGALAAAGVPPLNGFASKWLLYRAGVEAGHPFLTVIAVLVSAVTLIAYGKAFHGLFLGPVTPKGDVSRPSFLQSFPVWLLGLGCILMGLIPQQMLDILKPSWGALPSVSSLFQNWGYWEPVTVGIAMLVIGILTYLLILLNRSLTPAQKCPGKNAVYINGESVASDKWGCSYQGRELHMAGQHLYWAVRKTLDAPFKYLDFSFRKAGLGWLFATVVMLSLVLVLSMGGI